MTEDIPHLPRKPRYGDTLDVTILELSKRGHGVGRTQADIGPQRDRRTFRVEVRKALPGEHVRVRVERVRRNDIHGGVDTYLSPLPSRIEPRCAHFGRREEPGKGCGGCALQSLPYPQQLKLKRAFVHRCLREAGADATLLNPIVGQDPPWEYRNKMEFSFAPTADDVLGLGMHPVGYHREVVALERCHLLSEDGSALVVEAQRYAREHDLQPYRHKRNEGWLRTLTIREGKRTGERLVELTTSQHDPEGDAAETAAAFLDHLIAFAEAEGIALTSAWWTQLHVQKGQRTRHIEHHLHGEPVLHEALELPGGHRLTFAIHPRAFFQPNTLQAERLYAEALRATGLLDTPRGVVFDLYCGTGTIALCMAPYAEHVHGVELVEDAVENARRNARDNGLDNVTFYAGRVGDVLAGPLAGVTPELVLVDPPRSGLMPDATREISALAPPRLVYVSCNPEALGRDLVLLAEAGYTTRSITPIDMFPHTAHIECVALLERTSA